MLGLFSRKKSLIQSGLLKDAVDNHSHILPGVDDGVRTLEESLEILAFLEDTGFSSLWLTPHIMEDVPNTTEDLRRRFDALRESYQGPLHLHLAAEYMIDNLFEERLEAGDLLRHGGDRVLVETSTLFPPIGFWDIIDRMMRKGYVPLLAHPERYRYMEMKDYERLRSLGVLLQLNIPSLVGAYGESVQEKALRLLDKGMYVMAGSDCHRSRSVRRWYQDPVLKKDTLGKLRPLMAGLSEQAE